MGTEQRVFLVTGAAGFIGANLCHRLVSMGEQVHALIRPRSSMWRIESIQDKLSVHEVDICNVEQVNQTVAAVRPTIIYHLATHGAYHYQNDVENILLINVFGLWNLLNACNRIGYELFVNTGSSSEYGRKMFAMRETDILNPNSFYAVAKSAQSLLCQHCARTSGLAIVTLRLFSVYGPYEEPARLIPRLMMAALDDMPIDMVSPDTARDFVYVDDVIKVCLAVDKLTMLHGEILNVGTGVQSTLAQVVEAIEEVGGKKPDVRWNKMQARAWDSDTWVADISKLRRLTGYCPQTYIREGIAGCLPWFRRHRHFYSGQRLTL